MEGHPYSLPRAHLAKLPLKDSSSFTRLRNCTNLRTMNFLSVKKLAYCLRTENKQISLISANNDIIINLFFDVYLFVADIGGSKAGQG